MDIHLPSLWARLCWKSAETFALTILLSCSFPLSTLHFLTNLTDGTGRNRRRRRRRKRRRGAARARQRQRRRWKGQSEGSMVAGRGRHSEPSGEQVRREKLEPHRARDQRKIRQVVPAPVVQPARSRSQAQTLHRYVIGLNLNLNLNLVLFRYGLIWFFSKIDLPSVEMEMQ